MVLGFVCILAAAGVLVYTEMQERTAQSVSHEVALVFGDEIAHVEAKQQADTKTVAINGEMYMGILLIPQLELELPVADTFSYDLLQQTPCVFSGTMETEDLVIAAHNYDVHFGNLDQLEEEECVYFVDVLGKLHAYQLISKETVDGDDLEGLRAGEWDMTLFTCSHMDNAKRLVLRFIKEDTTKDA